jgi:hypothetical protein
MDHFCVEGYAGHSAHETEAALKEKGELVINMFLRG